VVLEIGKMSKPHNFKPQDQVQQQFGGPWMTVVSVTDHEVVCGWLDSKMESNEGTFQPEELRLTSRHLFKFV
jgi:uncharacterized protein YodC (DUF2158 family)